MQQVEARNGIELLRCADVERPRRVAEYHPADPANAAISSSETVLVEVKEGDAVLRTQVRVRKIVACSDADVEMVLAEVFAEEWELDASGGASPGEAVGDVEDPYIVERKKPERGVDGRPGG